MITDNQIIKKTGSVSETREYKFFNRSRISSANEATGLNRVSKGSDLRPFQVLCLLEVRIMIRSSLFWGQSVKFVTF